MPKSWDDWENVIETIADIEAIDRTTSKIWFGRKKFSTKHEDKLRKKIRPLDLLREQLFMKLWNLYRSYPEELDEIERRKVDNGKKTVTRIIWCDGVFHYVTTKKERFLYGYKCHCGLGEDNGYFEEA